MTRREVLLLLGNAVTAGRTLRAQQKAMPVIGFLGSTGSGPFAANVAAFRQGLSETGFVEGQNVTLEYRWAEDHYERLPGLAADLVGRKVDVIATGSVPASLAAKEATSTIPVVFETGIDPVEAGLVASLARPGANITGATTYAGAEIWGEAAADPQGSDPRGIQGCLPDHARFTGSRRTTACRSRPAIADGGDRAAARGSDFCRDPARIR
jgi:putative ABC transport system substrate-binding protein